VLPEELYLILALMAAAFVVTRLLVSLKYLYEKHPRYRTLAYTALSTLAIMSLYLSIVGGFIMMYMAVARYFQIIF
jgi:hypothetical protein